MEFVEKIAIGFVSLLLVFFVTGIFLSLAGFQLSTAEGQHTGYITAVEKTGILFKTYRAYIKTDTQSSQEEDYCVVDEKIVKELKKVQENKSLVTISFSHGHFVPITECDGEESIIRSIKNK